MIPNVKSTNAVYHIKRLKERRHLPVSKLWGKELMKFNIAFKQFPSS